MIYINIYQIKCISNAFHWMYKESESYDYYPFFQLLRITKTSWGLWIQRTTFMLLSILFVIKYPLVFSHFQEILPFLVYSCVCVCLYIYIYIGQQEHFRISFISTKINFFINLRPDHLINFCRFEPRNSMNKANLLITRSVPLRFCKYFFNEHIIRSLLAREIFHFKKWLWRID